MDEFFQKLREIQKKERNLSGLAPVGENFYQEVFKYFDRLMRKIDNNPFSFESYLLRDAQRIIAEICERREHKISKSAIMSVQRSYQPFKKSKSHSKSSIDVPPNSTPEEENLYHALVASLVTHREKMGDPLSFYSSQTNIELNNIPKANENSNIYSSSETTEEDNVANIYKKFGQEPSESSVSENTKKSKHPTKHKKIKDDNVREDKILENIINNEKAPAEVLMILEELPTIMGVDKKIYGPFSPQDIITMPIPNSRILIKNKKGKFIQKV